MLGQQIVNALVLGSVYGLLAIGMSLAFATTRIVNFAHGEFFTLGAFVGLTLQREARVPYPVAALMSALLAFAVSSGLAHLVLWRLRSALQRSVATIAIGLGLRDAMLLVFGSDSASFPSTFPEGSFGVFGVLVPRASVIVAAVTVVLLGFFWVFVQRSRWGIWMRATAQNSELAATSGIPTRWVQTVAFGLGSTLAAVAGLVVGPTWQVHYATGIPIALKAFTAAVLGGLGDLRGAIVGGLVLGSVEALFAGYVSSAWKDLSVYFLLVLAIVALPRGIFAMRAARLG